MAASEADMEAEVKFDLNELHDMEKKLGRRFDYVRLSLSDLNGVLRTNVVPRRHLEKNLTGGFSTFAGALMLDSRASGVIAKGEEEVFSGNMELLPCKGSLHECAWVGKKQETQEKEVKWLVGEVLCEAKWPEQCRGGSFLQACPRYALRRQLKKLQDMGLHLMSAFEIEYTLFHADTLKPAFPGQDIGASLVHSRFEDYLYTIERNLEKSGLDLEALRVEHGQGQFELVMEPKFGVKTADSASVMKEAIKEVSASMGYTASFMSLPFEGLSTNGFHLNLSLWQRSADGKQTNAFYDANDPDHISSTFRHFIAGLIKHAKALTAFCCPTFNCYRRFKKPWTPYKRTWGIDDRLVSFRVKKGRGSSVFLENRLPSSACNPYLATAATLAAGLDGLLNKLPLPQKAVKKIDSNFRNPKILDCEKNEHLPFSLEEALDELEMDDVLKDGLGEELLRWFVELKRKSEVEVLKPLEEKARWEKERELFFEFI